MAPQTLHRTLTLRTAVSAADFGGNDGGPGSLAEVLRALHERFATVPERRAMYEGQVIEGRHIHRGLNGVTLLHLVAYTPDDQISVVPRAGDVPAADLLLLDPPPNTEFLDGELMLLVNDNDVAVCRSGLGENAFGSYVIGLAERHGLDTAMVAFRLMKRADIDKLRMIRNDGVKRVSMNAIAHQASVEHVERTSVRQRILGEVWDEIKAVLGVEGRVPEDAENLKVEVLFSFDKRRGTELDQRQIEFLAEQMLADKDEGFMIETLSGRKVRSQDIVLSKPILIPSFGKSVHYNEAWEALQAFYAELNHP